MDPSEEVDDESKQDSPDQDFGDAEPTNRYTAKTGSMEKTEKGDLTKQEEKEVFTSINARGTIAGSLGRQSTQLEQEEPEILYMGWKKCNIIVGSVGSVWLGYAGFPGWVAVPGQAGSSSAHPGPSNIPGSTCVEPRKPTFFMILF
ncbi:hypothetical protein BT96DRAFT_937309 [Gymnopus androsaceus JB14]|uniref:Uncharacterized protein n=1 Tax=Gymnopus androsaceus JB14 TaxID=1447944 RepID=A0A6A4I082_9AGAR|nr:hypothetical protein BT96DRAFT_937309 [Gymnopus androsaceus JB14]